MAKIIGHCSKKSYDLLFFYIFELFRGEIVSDGKGRIIV